MLEDDLRTCGILSLALLIPLGAKLRNAASLFSLALEDDLRPCGILSLALLIPLGAKLRNAASLFSLALEDDLRRGLRR
jgi:hypothetical protein